MKDFLKRIFFRIKYYKLNVKIMPGVKMNFGNKFEGDNVIGNGTWLYSSSIGRATYIAGNSKINGTQIGRFCSIGENVRTCLGLHPSTGFVSTHPAFFSVKKQAGFTFVKKSIFEEHKYADNAKNFYAIIGNDVWIGNNVTIMDGITIGDGAIIAAGSIVTKNVEPYNIVAGIPARVIKKRFTDDQINFLQQEKWWNKDWMYLQKVSYLFKSIEDFKNIEGEFNGTKA